jgi:orotate phosphoribosyltransferase
MLGDHAFSLVVREVRVTSISDVLCIQKEREISHRVWDYDQFEDGLTQTAFTHLAKVCNAYWVHSGDPREPHAVLTSGRCSNGYINVPRVIKYSGICMLLGQQLASVAWPHVFKQAWLRGTQRDTWVVGSDHAAASLSFAVAHALGCKHEFTEKGSGKSQLWTRHTIQENEMVLQVEDMVTTALTLSEVRQGIRSGNSLPVTFAPAVLTLVSRSKLRQFEGGPILYLFHYDFEEWDQDDCPLCKAGSTRVFIKLQRDEPLSKTR